MMKNTTIFLAVLLSLSLLLTACGRTETVKLSVITSTTLVEYITRQVGGNYTEVTNLVPPNQHPGNYDVKPSDIQALASAKLFILQGVPGEVYADKLITSANNPDLIISRANVEGNWMIPSVQITATDKIESALSGVDSKNASAYQKSSGDYKQRISAKETDVKNKLASANVVKINVIASVRQADFLTWAGFNVVATFVSPQSLTPQLVKELVDKGKAGNVTLIVNNLQDGENAGKAIAEELAAKTLNLSNFPGGFSNTETWEKAIDYNVKLLLDAIQ